MKIVIALATSCLSLAPLLTYAKTVDVQRLSHGPVYFIAADPGLNAQSIDGMIPEGAPAFAGGMGQDLTVTFQKPGIYGFKCAPHYFIGMIGFVVVGDTHNENAYAVRYFSAPSHRQ